MLTSKIKVYVNEGVVGAIKVDKKKQNKKEKGVEGVGWYEQLWGGGGGIKWTGVKKVEGMAGG